MSYISISVCGCWPTVPTDDIEIELAGCVMKQWLYGRWLWRLGLAACITVLIAFSVLWCMVYLVETTTYIYRKERKMKPHHVCPSKLRAPISSGGNSILLVHCSKCSIPFTSCLTVRCQMSFDSIKAQPVFLGFPSQTGWSDTTEMSCCSFIQL